MRVIVTTDTHFNHKKLIEFGRPQDFERRIERSHRILPSDTVLIHLGDFCIGEDEAMHKKWLEIVGHIPHRILVRGNHDRKSTQWYLDRGWHAVVDQMTLKMFGKMILFSHIPVDPKLWPATDVNIHGHTHGNLHRDFEVRGFYDPLYHREIALENTNYQPVSVTDKLVG